LETSPYIAQRLPYCGIFVEEKWEEKKGILRSNKDRPMVLFTVINPNIKRGYSPCVIHVSYSTVHPSKILHSELLNNELRAKKEDMFKYLFQSNNLTSENVCL
jgi:hypothetical protein